MHERQEQSAPVDAPVAGATGAGVLLSVLLPEQNPYCGTHAVLCTEKNENTEIIIAMPNCKQNAQTNEKTKKGTEANEQFGK